MGLFKSRIYVANGFESPLFYKVAYSFFTIFGIIARFGKRRGYYTSEPDGFRRNFERLTHLGKVSDDQIEETDTKINDVNVRIYTPKESKLLLSFQSCQRSIMVYYHGGGFAIGDINQSDSVLYEFVKRLKIIVISVDYKMGPEYAYPRPIEDCMAVTKYVLNNGEEFGGNPQNVILAGDSAGGNIASVIALKLLKDKEVKNRPKLQILIYPWVQLVNQLGLPSSSFYNGKMIFSGGKITFQKFIAWYLGINNVTPEIESVLLSNSHFMLVEENLRKKHISRFNVDKIGNEFKTGKSYYKVDELQPKKIYPTQLDENHLLKRDQNLAKLLKSLFTTDMSPLLADSEDLKGLPKSYFLITEWDTLKDEGILYAERLKEVGVQVKIAFYEKAFHGILGFGKQFTISRQMLDDMIQFIKENI